MRNTTVNTDDSMDRLLFMMCVATHSSLTCNDNRINADLNNPHGLSERCTNIMVNSDVTMDKLLSMMFTAAHYSLTCTDNLINVDLNNPCGLGEQCEIVQ